MWPQFDGKCYTRAEFAAHVQATKWNLGFSPKYIVQHSTGVPDIKTAMVGDHKARIRNMALIYEQQQHWTHGPHVFCFPDAIYIMNALNVQGTHSSCDNLHSLGIECTGNFNPGHDDWDTGLGSQVRDNFVFVAAQLYFKLGLKLDPLVLHQSGHHFHSYCKADGHSICPGQKIDRADVVKRISAEMQLLKTPAVSA